MKGRVRPIAHARNQAMLDRVEVNVVDVALEVPFIANGMFPESSLPQRQFTIRMACAGDARRKHVVTEMPFDASPPSRKIPVARRQGENCVQMVWEHHN